MEKNNNYIIEVLNNELDIASLNEMQNKVIPEFIKNQNNILISKTGSGKTLCYVIPMLNLIDFDQDKIQAIIILPTKELVRQCSNIISSFRKYNNKIKYKSIIKNHDSLSINNWNFQILICMPSFFEEFTKLNSSSKFLKMIVIDEADMSLDLGFFPSINVGFNNIKKINDIKKIATSATLHETLSIQISKFFKNSNIMNFSPNIWTNENIKHYVVHFGANNKKAVLKELLKYLNPFFCIVFCNTKKEVDEIHDFLYESGFNVNKLHGGLDNRKRKNIYKEIKNLDYNILIATDLASRGIDIEGVSHVISYDLPKEDVWYIHRSGRSGRRHYKGESYVFNDDKSFYQISRLQRKGIIWKNIKFNKNKFEDFD